MNILIPYHERLPIQKAHDVYLVRTSHALARAGHTVHLFMGRGSPSLPALLAYYDLEPTDGIKLHLLPILRRSRGPSWSTPFHLFLWWMIGRLAERGEADVLFVSTLKLARLLLRLRWRLPLVYDLHELGAALGQAAPPSLRRLEAQVLPQAHGIVTTTRALEAQLRRTYPSVGSMAVVPLAVHRPRGLEPEPYPSPGPSTPRAFYVGQLYWLQGLSVALEALSRSEAPHLYMVGSGNEEVSLRVSAQRLGIGGRVHFTGFRAPRELPAAMAQAHWFLLPALGTGRMPYVAHMKCYDYLAYRRPIIASDLPSVLELLTDGETALLTSPGDPQALAQAMDRLLKDPDLARCLADQAWDLALQHSPERRAARLTAFFENVRAGRG